MTLIVSPHLELERQIWPPDPKIPSNDLLLNFSFDGHNLTFKTMGTGSVSPVIALHCY